MIHCITPLRCGLSHFFPSLPAMCCFCLFCNSFPQGCHQTPECLSCALRAWLPELSGTFQKWRDQVYGGRPRPLLTERLRPSASIRALRMGPRFPPSPTVLLVPSMQGVFGSSSSQLSPAWWPPAAASPFGPKGDGAHRLPSWGWPWPCCVAHR